jgi:hypothetical protein
LRRYCLLETPLGSIIAGSSHRRLAEILGSRWPAQAFFEAGVSRPGRRIRADLALSLRGFPLDRVGGAGGGFDFRRSLHPLTPLAAEIEAAIEPGADTAEDGSQRDDDAPYCLQPVQLEMPFGCDRLAVLIELLVAAVDTQATDVRPSDHLDIGRPM